MGEGAYRIYELEIQKAQIKKGKIQKRRNTQDKNQKVVFVQGGEGAYRIYELEEQTLGFRKIYDWLNKLKQTTAQTEEIHF